MSKIQIEQIEALSTNGNLQVTPNGTGILKVSGDTDGTLQLDNVKVKAPPSSAAQNYTLTLPASNVTADRFLKVNSITGSGSTAEGALEFAQIATPTASPINGNDFTSGSVPTARYNLSGAIGGGFKLIQNTFIGVNQSANDIFFLGLDENSCYRLVCRACVFSSAGSFQVSFLNSSNNPYADHCYMIFRGGSNSFTSNANYSNTAPVFQSNQTEWSFNMDFCTGSDSTATQAQKAYLFMNGHSNRAVNTKVQSFVSMAEAEPSRRMYGLKLGRTGTWYNFTTGTSMLLYKYQEV